MSNDDFTFEVDDDTQTKLDQNKPWSVTEIVAAAYCEQKAIYNLYYGDRPTAVNERKRQAGIVDHDNFEFVGKQQQKEQYKQEAAPDRRCFVASAVYGNDAPQTDTLRTWRDNHLLKIPFGSAIVRFYYLSSPTLVRVCQSLPGGIWIARKMLNVFVRRVGGK